MTRVAVVACTACTLGGGLEELREVLSGEGITDPIWHEMKDVRRAPALARHSLQDGADLIYAWGGDGTVQQCIDGLAARGATLAILPAGTANMLASNLNIPTDLRRAVDIGLHGSRLALDTGSINGEHFTLMAGAGLDALTMRDAAKGTKSVLGSAAYLLSGAKNLSAPRMGANIVADGKLFFQGDISLVLVANFGHTLGGIEAFSRSSPDDGILELGVVTAKNAVEWIRTLGRMTLGNAEDSPFTEMTRGKRFEIRFDQPFLYELDGNPKKPVKRLRVMVHAAAITICVPAPEAKSQP
jgi:diacylglycerol kinase (ATP)